MPAPLPTSSTAASPNGMAGKPPSPLKLRAKTPRKERQHETAPAQKTVHTSNLPAANSGQAAGVRHLSCKLTTATEKDKEVEPGNAILPERIIIFTTGSEIGWKTLIEETRFEPKTAPAAFFET